MYLHVTAHVDDFETWKAAFEGYHDRRVEYGAKGYQLYQGTDDPNDVVVVIEFDEERNARAWTEYLAREGELRDPEMRNVELSYLDLVEGRQLSPA